MFSVQRPSQLSALLEDSLLHIQRMCVQLRERKDRMRQQQLDAQRRAQQEEEEEESDEDEEEEEEEEEVQGEIQ